MTRISVVDVNESSKPPFHTLQATALELDRTANGSTLLLTVACREFGFQQEQQIRFALTPPAAMQLARALKHGVETYLRSRPEDG